MARRCDITGKGVQTGNNVSHSNRKTRRRFLPNVQQTSLYSDALGRMVDIFTDPLRCVVDTPDRYWGTAARGASALSRRGRFSETFDSVLYDSADSYAQTRSLYLQNRRFKLGAGQDASYLDPYDDPYGATFEAPDDDTQTE